MIFHIGIVGDQNSYHTFEVESDANEFTERVLNLWNNLRFAIERPLFPDAEAREWIAYQGDKIVRQMIVIKEEVSDGIE